MEKSDREKLLNQKGCVVWVTGLSGSGLCMFLIVFVVCFFVVLLSQSCWQFGLWPGCQQEFNMLSTFWELYKTVDEVLVDFCCFSLAKISISDIFDHEQPPLTHFFEIIPLVLLDSKVCMK